MLASIKEYLTILFKMLSGTFLGCGQRALADEWLNMAGAIAVSKASDITSGDT